MPKIILSYIRAIDAMNRVIGRMAMYLIFVLVGVLLWSSVSKTFFMPSLWTLEMAQFVMVAYYILGGPYSIQLGSNVRMDLFYGDWNRAQKAWIDAFTVLFLIFYLGVLLYGAISSTAYSLGYFGAEPFAFFGDLLRTLVTEGWGRAKNWAPGAQPHRVAALSLAGQNDHVSGRLSDAAAMPVRALQAISAGSRARRSDVL